MEGAGDAKADTFFQTTPGRIVLGASAVLLAGGVGWWLWKKIVGTPYLLYPEQPDGVVRVILEEVNVDERFSVLKDQAWDESSARKELARANKEDDYETYVCVLQDFIIFYTFAQEDKMDKALACAKRLTNCAKQRLLLKDVEPDYPILIDYLKALLVKANLALNIPTKQTVASKVLDRAVAIENVFFKKGPGPAAGKKDGKSIDWRSFPEPRVLYATSAAAQNAALKDQSTPSESIDTFLALEKYAREHLPNDAVEWSTDEVMHVQHLCSVLGQLYIATGTPEKALPFLKRADEYFDYLRESGLTKRLRAQQSRHLVDYYLAVGDHWSATVEQQKAVDTLVALLADVGPDEVNAAASLVIDNTLLLLQLLEHHPSLPKEEAKQRIAYYRDMLQTKYPQQLMAFLSQAEQHQGGGQ